MVLFSVYSLKFDTEDEAEAASHRTMNIDGRVIKLRKPYTEPKNDFKSTVKTDNEERRVS